MKRDPTPKAIYVSLSILVALSFLPRIFSLLPVYIDASTRADVMKRIEEIADERGWMKSDIIVESVSKKSIRFLYVRHQRGERIVQCYKTATDTPIIIQCARSF